MGACYDEMEIKGNISFNEVKKEFKYYQDICSSESGNSYSGRLNMCSGVEYHDKIFSNYRDAQNYISDNAKKWENAIAVKYINKPNAKKDSKYNKLNDQLTKLNNELTKLNKELSEKIEIKLKSQEFIKCSNCKSHMDTRFYKRTLKCPICESSFLNKTDKTKRSNIEKKINNIREKLLDHAKVLQNKSDKKNKGEIVWLVGGCCSS